MTWWSYNDLAGRTEAGSVGTQPCRGIAWWAHRNDEWQRRNLFLGPRLSTPSSDSRRDPTWQPLTGPGRGAYGLGTPLDPGPWPLPDLITLKQVADRLQLSERTLYRLLQRGELPGRKVGGQWRFRMSEVDYWLDIRLGRMRSAELRQLEGGEAASGVSLSQALRRISSRNRPNL